MEKKKSTMLGSKRSMQDYLSLGYLYLLALGIVRDAIYYGLLDVNILEYSNILDVLLSPVIYLTNNIIVPISLVVIIGLMFWLGTVSPRIHEKYKTKKWYKKLYNVEKLDQKYAAPFSIDNLLKLVAVMIFAFYLGTGIGGGMKMSGKLEEGTLKTDHQLIFSDKETLEVKVLGQNSQYIFYTIEEETQVSVTPIQNSIRQIRKLKK